MESLPNKVLEGRMESLPTEYLEEGMESLSNKLSTAKLCKFPEA